MQRRPFLRLAVAASAASAGRLGALGPSPDDGTGRESAPPANGFRTAAPDRTLSVSRAGTFDHVVRLNDLGDDPRGRVSAFADLTDRQRAVVATAIEGTHRSRDPPEWLREFVSATPFVERAGSYYRLDDTFPTHRVTASAVAESAVEGAVAAYEEYERAVTREEYAATGLLRLARREGAELDYVWPSLRSFFERYDAARYHGDVLDFAVDVEDAGPPHELSATAVDASAAVGGPVWRADAAPERVRGLVRRAGRARGAYGFDRAPRGFLDALRDHRYVALGDTFYTSYVEADGAVPLSVTAAFEEGRLRLAARNDATSGVRVVSGAPRPFGVVRCRPAGGSADGERGTRSAARLLWTDAYDASDRVTTDGRSVERTDDAALVSTLAPGESAAETYAVPVDLPAGEYVVDGSVDAETEESERRTTVKYRVAFAVE